VTDPGIGRATLVRLDDGRKGAAGAVTEGTSKTAGAQ